MASSERLEPIPRLRIVPTAGGVGPSLGICLPRQALFPRTGRAAVTRTSGIDYARRALALWPGLDRSRLRRAGCDPRRIVRLVGERSAESPAVILAMLQGREG